MAENKKVAVTFIVYPDKKKRKTADERRLDFMVACRKDNTSMAEVLNGFIDSYMSSR